MTRRFAAWMCVALLGVALHAAPASAHPEACWGVGTMTVSQGMFTAGTGTGDVNATWQLTATMGTCFPGPSLFAVGSIQGNCTTATGTGNVNGHSFAFTWSNGSMTWLLPVVGGWSGVPSFGQSCTSTLDPNGVHAWDIWGWVVT